MVKVHEQPAVTEPDQEPVVAKAHEQTKVRGKTKSHDQHAEADTPKGGARGLGIGIMLGVMLAVVLRTGMHWAGRSGLMGQKPPHKGLFNRARALAARLKP